ncbi:unnamed protein product [Lymnaea stagnalis]|uniref:Uncharacterized protein n=1 Tax=Lymnaea stagnalis TaxID=6523 RepID=A0AAV2I174_LYMST
MKNGKIDGVVEQESRNHWTQIPPKKTCFAISLAYTLVYTAFEAIQNLQSSINSGGNLGVTSLAISYGVVLISAPLSPYLIRVFGIKNYLLAAWVAVALYCSCNFYPALATFIPASILMGVAMGALGMIIGLYLSAAGKSYVLLNNLRSDRLHSVLSLFNGIFFMSFKSTQITGNLISSVVLSSSPYNRSTSENNVCGAVVCSATWDNSTVEIELPEKDVLYILVSVFLACIAAGFVVTLLLLPKLDVYADEPEEWAALNDGSETKDRRVAKKSVQRKHALENAKSCIGLLRSSYVLLVPLFMAQGMSVVVLFTGYTQGFVSCSAGIRWVGYTMIAYGASSSLVALSLNYLVRYLNRSILFVAFIGTDIGLAVAMLVWRPDSGTHFGMFFIIPALAGLTEGISQPQFNALISTVFKKNEPQAFACFHLSKCMAFALSLALSGVACLYHRLYLTLALYILGFAGYVVFEVRERRKKQSVGENETGSLRKP